MASARYLLNIQPEPPEQPPEKMTRKKKLENFWFYYKWHLIIGAVVLVLVGSFVYEMASQVDPDYQIAIVTETMLPDAVLEGLETQLAGFADDFNSDGKIKVSVMQYNLSIGGGDATNPADPYTQMAGSTKLMADAQSGDSMLYLTDDVKGFQAAHSLFAYNDGTTPAEGETPDFSRMGVQWADCPKLAALDLGQAVQFDGTSVPAQDYMKSFVLLPRAFEGTAVADKQKLVAYHESSLRLFDALTDGAR